MHNQLKLKIVLPILAAAISTTALAANDRHASTFKDDVVIASLDPHGMGRRPDAPAALEAGTAGVGLERQGISDERARIAGSSAQTGDIPAPHASAVPEAGSSDTCMGSKSSGIQLPMVGGVTFGSSWVDKNCMMIKNARELWNMGFKTAALARMCMDEQNREALESTGTPCPARRTDAASRRPEPSSLAYMQ